MSEKLCYLIKPIKSKHSKTPFWFWIEKKKKMEKEEEEEATFWYLKISTMIGQVLGSCCRLSTSNWNGPQVDTKQFPNTNKRQ